MLIVNHDHLMRTGVCSLDELCPSCSKAFAAYPLIMSDDAKQTVSHISCALELAVDILVDLDTFFRPPPPHPPLYVLTAPPMAQRSPGTDGRREETMYVSRDIHQIKAAIADQALVGRTLAWCPMGRVVAVRRRKGQLLAMIRGWGVRWYPGDSVQIERAVWTLLSWRLQAV